MANKYFSMPQKSDLIPKAKNYTPITKAPNYIKSKSNTKNKTTKPKTIKTTKSVYNPNLESYLGSGYASGGSGSGGGSYSASYARVPDISGLLAAYDQQADASRKIAQNAYNTTRNDLLTSLKRFQEQNAKDVETQKQSYLSEQSGLDYAREQANRQNRIAASSRGLGGSGLQQLAQLQTLMAQGEDISKAASSNQKAMDNLRAALQQKEDDTNTEIAKAQTTLSDTLSKIEATLAQQKADTIYQNEMAKLSGSSGGSGGSGGGSGSSGGNFDPIVEGLLESYNTTMQGLAGKDKKGLYKAVNSAFGTNFKKASVDTMKNYISNQFINKLGENMSSNMSQNYYNNVMNRAKAMAAGLNTKTTTTKKKTTTTEKKKKKKFLGLF